MLSMRTRSPLRFALAKVGKSIVQERDMLGWTPLLRSCTRIKLLSHHPCLIFIIFCIINLVIVGSDPTVVETLLKEGADPSATDYANEKSCLIVTALLDKLEECRFLLKFGADPKFTNVNGKTALEIATSLKNTVCQNVLDTDNFHLTNIVNFFMLRQAIADAIGTALQNQPVPNGEAVVPEPVAPPPRKSKSNRRNAKSQCSVGTGNGSSPVASRTRQSTRAKARLE
jgi:ankyrin repeat protein